MLRIVSSSGTIHAGYEAANGHGRAACNQWTTGPIVAADAAVSCRSKACQRYATAPVVAIDTAAEPAPYGVGTYVTRLCDGVTGTATEVRFIGGEWCAGIVRDNDGSTMGGSAYAFAPVAPSYAAPAPVVATGVEFEFAPAPTVEELRAYYSGGDAFTRELRRLESEMAR